MTNKLKEEINKVLRGCGNVAVQGGYNVAYCDGTILCKECISKLKSFKLALKIQEENVYNLTEKMRAYFSMTTNQKAWDFFQEEIKEIFGK